MYLAYVSIDCSGYMAPEYALHGLLSVKSDVFSYGVLVLEIVSGRKNQNPRLGSDMADLLSYVSLNHNIYPFDFAQPTNQVKFSILVPL